MMLKASLGRKEEERGMYRKKRVSREVGVPLGWLLIVGLILSTCGCVSDERLGQYDDDDDDTPPAVTHLPAKQMMILSLTTSAGLTGHDVSLVWQEQVSDWPLMMIEQGGSGCEVRQAGLFSYGFMSGRQVRENAVPCYLIKERWGDEGQ